MLTDLHNRGVQDILIACVDGLKGFPEAIQAIFPNTEVQLCVIHQIRNSIRYLASRDQKAFMRDLSLCTRQSIKSRLSWRWMSLIDCGVVNIPQLLPHGEKSGICCLLILSTPTQSENPFTQLMPP